MLQDSSHKKIKLKERKTRDDTRRENPVFAMTIWKTFLKKTKLNFLTAGFYGCLLQSKPIEFNDAYFKANIYKIVGLYSPILKQVYSVLLRFIQWSLLPRKCS